MSINIRETIKQGRLFLDGSLGTMLQTLGLGAGEFPELWNVSHPEEIVALHSAYLRAGSKVLTANTFGVNRLKFPDSAGAPGVKELIGAAVENARTAIANSGADDIAVALDIGPTGKLLQPFGDLDFEDAVALFAEVVRCGVECGVDLILIETMNDCYETKAAVLAAKENSDLPVFVANTYDQSGKLMTGATPSAMVAMLEGLRVDALGINCGFGPDRTRPIVEELLRCTSVPVIAIPNAGMPVMRDGKTQYDISPAIFADEMEQLAKLGVGILGGCCGTTPQHIEKMVQAIKELPYTPPEQKNKTMVSSYAHSITIGDRPVLIGERINPTGKPKLKRALREQDMEYILQEGVSQQEAGADILDVNAGLPEIDEPQMLYDIVTELQTVSKLPLQLDTANPGAMEKALRVYNGKALINSVNGKQSSMAAVFPLAAKYGGVVVALTLDENGIPDSADGRIAIAEKIIRTAAQYGIGANDIVVDPLTMAVSTEPQAAMVTLECIRRLHDMGIRTSIGASNVSFGLPQRGVINAAFFTMAMTNGLDMAIMNPHAKGMMDAYHAFCALTGRDAQCQSYIAYAADQSEALDAAAKDTGRTSPDDQLKQAIVKGLKDNAAALAEQCLQEHDVLAVINRCIVPALDEVGAAFESKKAFLPQLLMSAEAAKAAFEVLRARLAASGEVREKKGRVVLATVQGDVHDIGKNIVKSLLENYDYEVIDLGRDVAPAHIVDVVLDKDVRLVGLSALMTTTVPAMQKTIELLRQSAPDCKVVVGGAVLTQAYADRMGADKYAKDAMETVRYAEQVL